MNIRQCIFLVVALYSGSVAFGQTKTNVDTTIAAEDAKASPTNLAKAKFQIYDIKNRGIIVRLKTNKDRIEAYRREGYYKVADKIDRSSQIANLRLTYAFITEWTYSPVYFMESQYTKALLLHDSLVAKTPDLLRDTVITVNRDSFYIVDFGEMMATQLQDGQLNHTEQSTTPMRGESLMVKDHDQKQLQPPMPYFSEALFSDIDKVTVTGSAEIVKPIFEPWQGYLQRNDGGKGTLQKDSVNKYIDRIYDYIASKKFSDKYTKTAHRLNKKFISYYCKRLNSDRNLICNDEEIYWWHRNPNIRYLTAIPELEQRLDSYTEKGPQFIRKY